MKIKKYIFGKNTFKREFTYSLFDIEGTISNTIEIENSLLALQDIGFSSGFIDKSTITTFANGSLAVVNKFYDQKSNFPPLTNPIDANRPYITDGSGIALDYIDDTIQEHGLFLPAPTKLNASGDKIFQYVIKNETENANQRPNFRVLDDSGKGFTLSLRGLGGNYIIGVNIDGKLWSDTDSTGKRWVVPKETPGNFRLYTFTYIGGVHNLYVNNVIQVGDSTAELLDSGSPQKGIFLGLRSDIAVGKKNNIQTLSMITSPDLSGFDIDTYNNSYMTIHGL